MAQRAHYSKRRKEIWEALHPEPSVDYGREDGEEETGGPTRPTSLDTLPDGRKKGPQHHQSFAAATAEVTGQSKRDINRNVARAEAIGDDLLRLTGTSLDKGVFVTVTKPYRGGFRLRSTTKDSNCPMRTGQNRHFVPRFVPRFALRYPHQSGQTAIGLTEPHGPELAYLDELRSG